MSYKLPFKTLFTSYTTSSSSDLPRGSSLGLIGILNLS